MSLPILFHSSSGATDGSAGSINNRTLSWTHNGPTSGTGIAVVAYLHVTTASTTASATGSGTYGGQSMNVTKLNYGDGPNFALLVFRLANAPAGSQTVSLTINGMTTNFLGKQYAAGVAVYTGVSSVEAGITASLGGGTGTSLTLSETNTRTFDRYVTVHGHEQGSAFSSYSLTQRQTSGLSDYSRGLLGDSLGNGGTLNSTTTLSSADYQGAVSVRLRRSRDTGFLWLF